MRNSIPPAIAGSSATTVKVCPAGAGSCDSKRETSALNGEAQAASVGERQRHQRQLRSRGASCAHDVHHENYLPKIVVQFKRGSRAGAETAIDGTCHKPGGLNSG